MLDSNEDTNRQIVPRWRSFRSAVKFGELFSLKSKTDGAFTDSVIADILDDWKREPGLSVACDVVSAAFATGRDEAVRDIAQFVVNHRDAPVGARHVANCCLGDAPHALKIALNEGDVDTPLEKMRAAIHDSRQRLSEYPINPVLWTNLALLHTILGARKKADRVMRVALDLAPGNRFVVRAACRMFLHHGDVDRAHRILSEAPSARHDPWVMAGEIAVAGIRGRPSKLVTNAKRMIEARNYSPFHLSELTSALATIEAHSGGLKKARQLCERSLADPAENAVAQAVWLERNCRVNVRTSSLAVTSRSNEAEAWTALAAGIWDDSMAAAKSWQIEQPFSSRPAIFGGYIATLLDDFAEAERILTIGRAANRDDPMLGNNLAFSLANQGKLDEAANVLRDFIHVCLPFPAMCLTATTGLVYFRAGDLENGRLFYQRAIEIAKRENWPGRAAIAKVHLAIEELRHGTDQREETLREARLSANSIPMPLASLYLKKLKAAEKARTSPLV